MTTDAPIPADATTRREAAVWIAAAVATIAARFVARQLTARRPVWAVLAVALAIAAGAWTWRAGQLVSNPYTFGATHVNAASEPGKSGPALQDIAVNPLLQDGYADPTAGEDDRAVVDDPMRPLVPESAYEQPAGPGIAPPGWMSPGIGAYWDAIVSAAVEQGIDPHVLALVAEQENPNGDAGIVTFDGGHGLMQIQAATASMIEAQSGLPCVDGWGDPLTSFRCGAFYLRQGLDDGADLARPGDPEPMILVGVAGYNSGHRSVIVGQLRAALVAGAADPCGWIGNQFTRQYCYRTRDRWAQSVAERAGGTMLEAMR